MNMTWENFLLSLIWEASSMAPWRHRVEFRHERMRLAQYLSAIEGAWISRDRIA